MNDKTKKIIDSLSCVVKKVFPNKEGQVFLYGSQARGEANIDSDWDILIITKQKTNTQALYDKFVFPFAEVGWYENVEIIPVSYSEEEWESKKHTLFYQNVMRDAIRLGNG